MPAFTALLRYDLGQMVRSWLLRIWFVLLVVPGAFLVVVAGNENELASETLAAYLAAIVAPLTWLAVSVLAAGAIAAEAPIAADSILPRSVTRSEYLAAKIVSRVGAVVGAYLVIMSLFSYLVVRYALDDTSRGGMIGGILEVAALIAFLAALGILLSVLIRNQQVAAVVTLLSVVVSGALLQFLELDWLSATAVINDLPDTMRGDTSAWEQLRVITFFAALTIAALALAGSIFRRKDL